MDAHTDCWHHHQHTLPPVSSILPDHAYTNANPGHHYPVPPQGEGNVYAHYQQVYQQPQQQQQQPSYFPQAPQGGYQQQGPPPSYQPQPQELPYLITNPIARGSSSTVSSTRYAPSSNGSAAGPATSAERRSLSDGEDEEDSDENLSGGSTPLPPYYATNPHQQVCFVDGALTPSSRSASESSEFVCDVCSVSYSRAPDLRRHKASVHNDRDSREKVSATFPCEVCGQVLLSSHGYQGHMRRHYDERPFVCEAAFCGKAFHDSATLARHRRTHSAEHKFECDFCGRRFKRKDNLNTHRKKHQVGGETINPNLLRKPVSRVGSGSSAGDSPVEGTPASQAFADLPPSTVASPPYQHHVQVLPLSQPAPPPAPTMMDLPVPTYTSLPMQMDTRRQQQQQAMYAPQDHHQPQQQQQLYHHPVQPIVPPYHHHHQQTISLQSQPSPYLYHPHHVKAEEMSAMAVGLDGRARVYAVPRH